MGLYLGSNKKLKINLVNGGAFRLSIPSSTPITNGSLLLSSDNYILKDSRGVYLTAKEDN